MKDEVGGFFADKGSDCDAHSAHFDGAECVFGEFFDDRGFGFAHAHDAAPAHIDFVGGVGEDNFFEKLFELVLDDGGLGEIGGFFSLKVEVTTAAKENSVADVAEVVVAHFVVECALEWEIIDWFCY